MRYRLDPLSPTGLSPEIETKVVQTNGYVSTPDLSNLQPKDATLTALAAHNTNGLLTQTAADTFTGRTITGTTNQITVTNGNGVSGNPTLSLPQNIHTTATPTFGDTTINGNVTINAGNARVIQKSSNTAQYSEALSRQYFTNASFGNNAGVNFGVIVTDTGASDTKFAVDRITNAGAYSANLFAIQASTKVATFYGNLTPNADSANTLGTSSLYWLSTHTDTLYLNATASLSGATAGAIGITGLVGLGTTAPTHTLTLPSTSTGIALYNTADQTTNYERLLVSWATNVLTITTEKGGSGTGRNLAIGTPSAKFNIQETPSSFGTYLYDRSSSTANTVLVNYGGTHTQSSGTFSQVAVVPTINQSGTASYTALLINPNETATGSGTKLLIDAQVGGVSKFKVDNAGTTSTKGRKQAVAIKSANYTLTSADEVVVFTATATATLPAATGSGQTYRIICRAGNLTIDANASETIKGELTQSITAGEDLIITDTETGVWE